MVSKQDISFKVQRAQNVIQRTSINQESPWKLQQVQDAANHLQQAIHHIDNVDSSYHFKLVLFFFLLFFFRTSFISFHTVSIWYCYRSSDEVLHILGNILGALQRGRTSLVIPKKKPIDELMKSRNMVN